MKPILRATVALLVGVLTFLGVLVAVTELLAPHVWPALIVSVPVALVAGVVVVGFAYLGLRYREERAATGRASRRTVSLLGGFGVGVAAFVATGVAVTAALGALAVPLLTAMLFGGFPTGTVVGVVAGWVVARRLAQADADDGREAPPTA